MNKIYKFDGSFTKRVARELLNAYPELKEDYAIGKIDFALNLTAIAGLTAQPALTGRMLVTKDNFPDVSRDDFGEIYA